MKLLASLSVLCATAWLSATGVLPCPCELAGEPALAREGHEAPGGLYLEVRNATVWGGACHIGSEAVSQGSMAAAGWAFEGGRHAGVPLGGVRVVAVLQGTANLQGKQVFRAGSEARVRSALWVDAPGDAAATAAVELVRARLDLGELVEVHRGPVTVARSADRFRMSVPGILTVEGEALPDRSCCTMPESLWYSPLDAGCEAVVGNPERCRFEGVGDGHHRLSPWAFEGENSAFIGSIGV